MLFFRLEFLLQRQLLSNRKKQAVKHITLAHRTSLIAETTARWSLGCYGDEALVLRSRIEFDCIQQARIITAS